MKKVDITTFIPNIPFMIAINQSDNLLYYWESGAWHPISGGGGGYANPIAVTIPSDASSYQNDLLIGASGVEYIFVNSQILIRVTGSYSIDYGTGTITYGFFTNDTLVVPYRSA